MKKALISTFILLTYSGLTLSAQAFDGVNIDIGAGQGAADVVETWNSVEYYPGYIEDKTKLSLGFSKSFAERYNLSASAFYMPGQSNAGYGSSENYPTSINVPLKLKETYGLVVEPGYYFEKNTLAFLRAGYARSSMTFEDLDQYLHFGDIDGLVYGLGLKHKFNSHLYIGLEAQRIAFAKQRGTTTRGSIDDVKSKPTTSYFGLNLGYTLNDIYEPAGIYRASNFDGPYLQATLGNASYHTHTDWDQYGSYNEGMHVPQVVLSAGYSQSFAYRLNLGINLFSNLREERVYYQEYDEVTTAETLWGISVEPGYSFSESALAYFKLGAASTALTYSDDGNDPLQYGRIQGALYGAGYKHVFKDNIFVGLEGYRIAFGRSSKVSNPVTGWGLARSKLNYNFVGLTLGYTV